MRITALVLEENYRSGTNPKGPWQMLSVRCMEKNPEKEIPNAKEIIEITLSDDDIADKGTLEGEIFCFDILGFKPGYRGHGVEFRGLIVREGAAQIVQPPKFPSTAAA